MVKVAFDFCTCYSWPADMLCSMLCVVQIGSWPPPPRGRLGTSHFFNEKRCEIPWVGQYNWALNTWVGQYKILLSRGSGVRHEWCPQPSPRGGWSTADLNHTLGAPKKKGKKEQIEITKSFLSSWLPRGVLCTFVFFFFHTFDPEMAPFCRFHFYSA